MEEICRFEIRDSVQKNIILLKRNRTHGLKKVFQ